jgi:hypothetical protein
MVRQIGCSDLSRQEGELLPAVLGGVHEYLMSEVVVQKMHMICSAPIVATKLKLWPAYLTSLIRSKEQIAQGAAEQIRKPSLREMMGPVMHDVAALAKAAEIAQLIVGRIMVEMSGRQHDPRRPHLSCFL